MTRRYEEVDPIEIDVHHLDREWQAQPRLFRQAALQLAEAQLAEGKAKSKLEVVEAELTLAIKTTPERYNVTGRGGVPSDKVVEAAVVVQHEYRLARQELLQAEHAAKVAKALVDALIHKKAALENSVILWCRDYGAECKVPNDHAGRAREKLDRATGGSPWKGATPEVTVE